MSKEAVCLECTKDVKDGTCSTGILCNSRVNNENNKPASSEKTKADVAAV